jgi:hypothetical protein
MIAFCYAALALCRRAISSRRPILALRAYRYDDISEDSLNRTKAEIDLEIAKWMKFRQQTQGVQDYESGLDDEVSERMSKRSFADSAHMTAAETANLDALAEICGYVDGEELVHDIAAHSNAATKQEVLKCRIQLPEAAAYILQLEKVQETPSYEDKVVRRASMKQFMKNLSTFSCGIEIRLPSAQ